jgi:hypothetical protein
MYFIGVTIRGQEFYRLLQKPNDAINKNVTVHSFMNSIAEKANQEH